MEGKALFWRTHFLLKILSLGFGLFLFNTASIAQPQIVWDQSHGGIAYEESLRMFPIAGDNYVIGGTTSSGNSGDVSNPNQGLSDFWVYQINGAGNITWDESYGGSGSDFMQDMIATSDGGYLMGGFSFSDISGVKSEANRGFPWTNDYWVVKVDGTGAIQWDRTFGGDSNDQLTCLLQTSDGGYLLGGWSLSDVSGDKTDGTEGAFDIWVVKLDASGNYEWDQTYGGTAVDMLFSMVESSDGNVILGGMSASPISGDKVQPARGSIDYWILKIDLTGNILWSQTFGGTGNDQLRDMINTTDGNILVVGFSDSNIGDEKSENSRGLLDYWAIKMDENGNILWDATFGGPDIDDLSSVMENNKNNYVLCGSSLSGVGGDKTEPSNGDYDYWMVYIDQAGNKLYDKAYGGTQTDILRGNLHLADNGYLVGGFSASDISGDKTDGTNGDNDSWVIRIGCGPVVNLGSDTTYCPGTTVTFNARQKSVNGCDYLWSTGATTSNITVSPIIDTDYAVTVTDIHGCMASDTIRVFVADQPIVNLGADISTCVGDTILLDAGNPGLTYLWSDGSTTQTLEATLLGTYAVTVTNAEGCTDTDEINISYNPRPIVNLGAAQAECQNNAPTLNAGNFGSTYIWSTGETTREIIPDTTGTYTVTVTNSFGCIGIDSVDMTIYPLPQGILMGDTAICEGEAAPISFNLQGAGPFDVRVTDGLFTYTFNPINDGYSFDFTPSITTTYTLVQMTDSSPGNCQVSGNSVTIVVNNQEQTSFF